MYRRLQSIFNYCSRTLFFGLLGNPLVHHLLVGLEFMNFLMVVEILCYKYLITENSNIICMPLSLHFWLTIARYIPYVIVPSFLLSICLFYNSPRRKEYLGLFSILLIFSQVCIILYGLIFLPLFDISGAIVRENEFSNVLFQFNYDWFKPEVLPILVGKGPFNVYGVNLTKKAIIFDSNYSCLPMKFSEVCYASHPSILNRISTILRCQSPFDKSVQLFESHFAPIHRHSCIAMFCAVCFVSWTLIFLRLL